MENETATQKWLRGITFFPYVLLLMWGVAIGMLLSPLIAGAKIGFQIVDEFWGFKPGDEQS